MALTGSLKDFSITDIFTLVSQQQKTGVLTLSSREEKAQVAFDNGMVVMAGSDLKRMDDLLGQKLVKSGLITRVQLDEALLVQKDTLQMLGQILLEKGRLDKEALRRSLLLQVQETVYRLLEWTEGNYDFLAQEVAYDKGLYTPLSTEYLLMEGHRIHDEWPQVRKTIPTTEGIYRRKDGEVPDQGGPGLLPEQEKVLALVDGIRKVHDIVDASMLGEFEATKALADLLARGTVEQVREAAPAPTKRISINLKDLAVNFVSLVLIVVVAILILSYATLTSRKVLSGEGERAVSLEHSLDALGDMERERIRNAVEIYFLEHEAYPDTLQDLVAGKYLRREELTFPWGREYYYKRRGGDYILLQPKR